LDEYGVPLRPARQPGPARPPLPRKVPPPELLYAVVVKRREHGHWVEVSTHGVYGTPAQIAAALEASPVSATISTYAVERNNLTMRQHARRVARRVNAFSKERDYVGRATHAVVRVLSLCHTPSWLAPTTSTTNPDQGLARLASEMARAHSRHGGRIDRPPLDDGRIAQLSCATQEPVVTYTMTCPNWLWTC